ncbi:hypothetical protein ILUMI_13678 [Ignelater luminosus]|uniref:Uncharacterized protein n=1 Tax=Ignelater luminosus TaxID=2038154 RepID=A0A8K0D0A1_IGNLU|nr:hypothetical protein ILUMI_13678 [Ignelater luminosus]
MYPAPRERRTYTQTIHPETTYAQMLQQSTQPTQATPAQRSSELTELKNMMKNLMEQLGTLLNLLTTSDTEKASGFAQHLSEVFQPHAINSTQAKENEIQQILGAPSYKKVHNRRNQNSNSKSTHPKQAPGWREILKEERNCKKNEKKRIRTRYKWLELSPLGNTARSQQATIPGSFLHKKKKKRESLLSVTKDDETWIEGWSETHEERLMYTRYEGGIERIVTLNREVTEVSLQGQRQIPTSDIGKLQNDELGKEVADRINSVSFSGSSRSALPQRLLRESSKCMNEYPPITGFTEDVKEMVPKTLQIMLSDVIEENKKEDKQNATPGGILKDQAITKLSAIPSAEKTATVQKIPMQTFRRDKRIGIERIPKNIFTLKEPSRKWLYRLITVLHLDFINFYTPASVPHMLSGHSYARAIWAHCATLCALSTIVWEESEISEEEKKRFSLTLDFSSRALRFSKLEQDEIISKLRQQVQKLEVQRQYNEVQLDKRKWIDEQTDKTERAETRGYRKESYNNIRQLPIKGFERNRPVRDKPVNLLTSVGDQIKQSKQYFSRMFNPMHKQETEDNAQFQQVFAQRMTDMIIKLNNLNRDTKLVGLKINIKKTKDIRVNEGSDNPLEIEGEVVKKVEAFQYLESIVTINGGSGEDV